LTATRDAPRATDEEECVAAGHTGQRERLRTVTPHRLLLAAVTALAGRNVETLTDLRCELSYHNDTTVATQGVLQPALPPWLSRTSCVRCLRGSSSN
jgi:hypothetical protein